MGMPSIDRPGEDGCRNRQYAALRKTFPTAWHILSILYVVRMYLVTGLEPAFGGGGGGGVLGLSEDILLFPLALELKIRCFEYRRGHSFI